MEKSFKKSIRVVIYIKDIELIMGLKPGAARLRYLAIKKFFKKEKHQVVTAEEFCRFTGIKEESIQEQLRF